MDNSMGLISVILVITIFLPFFYIGFLGSKKKRQMKQRVKKTLAGKGARPTSKELWGNTFIGINTEKSVLYFIKFAADEMVFKEIGLADLHAVEIVKHTEKLKGKGSSRLLRLDLELIYNHNGGPKLPLTFFDSSEEQPEDYEVERAERWKARLLSHRLPRSAARSVA